MGLTASKWKQFVADLPYRLRSIDRSGDEGGLKEAMIETWRSISLAPSETLQLYEQTTEAQITTLSAGMPIDMAHTHFGMHDLDPADNTKTLAVLGGFLRSLETELFEFELGEAPVDPASDWRVELGDEAFLLIPIAKRSWRRAKDPALDRRPFAQRGLARSRVVPVEVGAATVKPTWLEYFPDGSGASTFGAALFDAIEFTEDRDETSFLVTAVSGSDMTASAESAVEAAHVQECIALVFPELTIDDDLLDRIKDALAFKHWPSADAGATRKSPSITVAGSWHRPRGGGYANVSVILDGYGKTVLEHHKRFVFKGPDGRSERIIPGQILDLLITQDGIFTFGICLDFCHMSYETSYGELNADFVLVPSCGNDVTMQGHVAQAYRLMIELKTRCFVVQQAYPNLPYQNMPAGKGFVLQPRSDAAQPSVTSLVSTENCSFFTADPFA